MKTYQITEIMVFIHWDLQQRGASPYTIELVLEIWEVFMGKP